MVLEFFVDPEVFQGRILEDGEVHLGGGVGLKQRDERGHAHLRHLALEQSEKQPRLILANLDPRTCYYSAVPVSPLDHAPFFGGHLHLEVGVAALHEVGHDTEDADPGLLDVGPVLQLGGEVAERAGHKERAQRGHLVVLDKTRKEKETIIESNFGNFAI